MKVATTMKIIVTTTMDMVLHNGYVRLLVEVVDGDGDVNKGEVGYCCLSLVMVCHLLMFVFFLFVVCLCLAFVVVFRLPLFVVRCCLLVVVISRLALFGACRLLLFVVCRCSRLPGGPGGQGCLGG